MFGITVTPGGCVVFNPFAMTGRTKKLRRRPDGGPLWYAAEWLLHLNMRQSEIVARTDYTKSQVSEWITGRERFNADSLYNIAKAIGVDAADLLRPPVQADDELARYIKNLDVRQRAVALKLIQAAELIPAKERKA
jgi:transcriptional regulator with XRE-family HTH domain